MNRLSAEKRALILSMLVEGMGVRSVSRITGSSVVTILRLLVDAGEACQAYHDRTVRNVRATHIQADEVWSFCGMKEHNLSEAAPDGAGDCWTWVALDTDSRMVLTWRVGRRTLETGRAFMRNLRSRVVGRVQINTDALVAYQQAIEDAFGDDVDFVQTVKLKESGKREPDQPSAAVVARRVVCGRPDLSRAGTSHVERCNLTIRMSNRRFNRRTNAHSKKIENHKHALALGFTHYNFCRIHETLQCSPAMAAGVTDTLRELDWIVDLIEARQPVPKKPGPKPGTRNRPRRQLN